MKLVVGLGNPGRRYARTRHNVGYRVAEALARRAGVALDAHRLGGRFGRGRIAAWDDLDLAILLPETWMNRSGSAVAEAVRLLPVEDAARDVCVVFDDADLPFGKLRMRARGSDGGHRGLADVLSTLATLDVPRLRFGIGRPEQPIGTRDFVLERFSRAEERELPAHLERAVLALVCFLREGVAPAMNRFNADPAN